VYYQIDVQRKLEAVLTSAGRKRPGPLPVSLTDTVRSTQQLEAFDTRVSYSVRINKHVTISLTVRSIARMTATACCIQTDQQINTILIRTILLFAAMFNGMTVFILQPHVLYRYAYLKLIDIFQINKMIIYRRILFSCLIQFVLEDRLTGVVVCTHPALRGSCLLVYKTNGRVT